MIKFKFKFKSYLASALLFLSLSACTQSQDSGGISIEPPRVRKTTKENYLSGKKFCEVYSEITSKEFGRFVTVPKDYSDPSKGSLDIYVYSTQEFDPSLPTYIYVNGGPGQNTHGYRRDFLKERFNELSFDQRGLGCSAPETWEEYRDSDLYSTENTIKDMELIRQAYKIEKWTLYGVSYGTVPATMYGSRYPEVTRSVVLEGIYASADKVHQLSYKLNQLNLVLAELSSIQRDAFIDIFFEDSPDGFTVYDYVFESYFDEMGMRNLRSFIIQMIGPNGEIDRSLIGRIRIEMEASEKQFPYPQYPGVVDGNIMDIIFCKDLGLRQKPVERLWYNDSKGFYTKPSDKDNNVYCDQVGIPASKESTYKVQEFPVLAPVYYFQGSHDGATMALGAIDHWKAVPQGESYFMMAQKGGHNPNSAKLRSRSVKLAKAQAELFYLSIAGRKISGDDIDDVNIHSSPANIWKLYLQKDRHLNTGIENDLGGISALKAL